MTEQEQEVLDIIVARLGDKYDVSQNALIETYIKEIGRRILHYCQRSDIPEGLNWVWASMVMDALQVEQPDQFGGGDADGMTVKIGDTSVGPAKVSGVTTTSKKSIDDIVLNYKADLHRFRKLRW